MQNQRVYSLSLLSRINPNKTLGFRNTWFSHPKDLVFSPERLGFLPSHQGYSQTFLRKPSVSGSGIFLFGFCLVLENQATVWFSSVCVCF
jgi:hypothetical protein